MKMYYTHKSRYVAIIILVLSGMISFSFAEKSDYEVLHEKGKILYQANKEREALAFYQEILEYYPDDVDALLFRGRIYARLKAYDLSETDLLQVIESAPDYLDAYYALASTYYWRNKLEKARVILTEWLRRDPENPDVYILSARVAIANRKFAAARTFLEGAIAFDADEDIVESLVRMINSPSNKTRWVAGLRYEYLVVDQERPDWQFLQTSLTYDFSDAIATIEINRYKRNDMIDYTAAMDVYFQLWDKAYMNSRLQAALIGNFMPQVDVNIELFQAIGARNEPALGYRLMHYDSLAAHIPSIAWGAYPGDWYIRDKVSMIINDGISWQNQFTLRYFFENVDTYLQFMNVLGTDFNVYDNEWVQSIAISLNGQFPLSDHILLHAGLSWTRDEFLLNRIGGLTGISYRW